MAVPDLARLRLRAQGLASPACDTPSAVVRHLGAAQAQDYEGALWSIALRTAGATRADVERAIAERMIVRTWPMRGTLHFVPAADARWMLELLAPRIMRSAAGRHRQLELDAAAFARSRAIIGRALADHAVLSRPALYAALEAGGVSTAGQRGIHILQQLCMERMLCHGPRDGRQPTFVLFDDWIPASRQLHREEALRVIAERYFVSHGPATLRDFVGWTGLTVADATVALRLAHPVLTRLVAGDDEHWMSPELEGLDTSESDTHLLPGFDELLLGYKDRSATLAPRHAARVVPGGNGVFRSTLVLGARVHGTWQRSARPARAGGIVVEASPFTRPTAAQRSAFSRRAEHYARYLGVPVALQWRR